MKRAWQYFLALGLLVTGIVAAVLDWPLFYAAVIDPIARIFWLVERLFLVLDQEVYWILLLFTGFIIGALMIPNRAESLNHAGGSQTQQVEDRVAYWEGLLRSADTDPDARMALQLDLQNLQNSVQSLAEMDEPGEISLPAVGRSRGLGKLSRNKWMQSIKPILALMENAMEITDDQPNNLHDR